MKNNRGFIFIETILVISFLATSLILIYNSFVSVLTIEKRRVYYDDPIFLYRTYYILDFYETNNITAYLEEILPPDKNNIDNKNLLFSMKCNVGSVIVPNEIEKQFCESIINTNFLSVTNIYFTYFDTTPISDCSTVVKEGSEEIIDTTSCKAHESLKSLSNNAKQYVRSLGGAGKDGYRMIVEYQATIKNEQKYYYATVRIPFGE